MILSGQSEDVKIAPTPVSGIPVVEDRGCPARRGLVLDHDLDVFHVVAQIGRNLRKLLLDKFLKVLARHFVALFVRSLRRWLIRISLKKRLKSASSR